MDFLEEELEEILNIFREESEEQIQKINQSLLKLEANPNSSAIINELFREAHSIKGAARMIGLTDIQNLAHKVEDIFGLAREGNLTIDSNIVDKLCKAVDCIASIIEESIESKGQSHSDAAEKMIEQLEDIKKLASSNPVEKVDSSKEEKTDSEKAENATTSGEESNEAAKLFYDSSITVIPAIKANILKLKESSMDNQAIVELQKIITDIDELAQNIDIFEIQEPIGDLRLKLDGVVKGSGILLPAEVDEIEELFDNFSRNFDELGTKLGNDPINFDNKALAQEITEISLSETDLSDYTENIEEISQELLEIEKNNAEKSESDFDFVSNNIMLLSSTSAEDITTVDLLTDKLRELCNLPDINNDIKKIFEKVYEIAVLSKSAMTKPNHEISEVVKQSFDTACLMITSPDEVEEDPNLIVQRLAILYQMLNLTDMELQVKTENDVIDESSAKNDLSPVAQTTEVLAKNDSSPLPDSIGSDSTTIKTLRVDTRKLDQLVNQVGELIIAKIKAKEHLSEIEKIIHSIEDWYREWNKSKQFIKYLERRPLKPHEMPSGTSVYSQNKNMTTFFEESSSRLANFLNQMNSLYRIVQEDDARLNLIANELEERIKSVRVLPLATIFHMFPRMVRDIARDKGKNIDLVISGSETSVDKKIIEEIKSPLIHIIRNSIDHGIEDPQTRIKNGKNPTGKIHLSAYHLENSVLIEIIDDGRGIDLEAIKRKVIEKGLLTPAELQSMNDNQIMNIIFWPGFSTGETVTDISGRGIGLDVVHTKITQLNGKVNIKSTLGEGCRVSIQLPVTMATIQSFLVSVNGQTFAIPTSAVKTALLVKPEEIFYKEGRETIIVDNRTVPICKLSKILEMPDKKISDGKIVVVIIQAEDVQVGFIIDKLIGDQEILHKNLTPPLLRVRNVAGVTTLGSGELCLILNVSDLIKSAYSSFGMGSKQLIINKESNTAIKKSNILVVDDSVTTRILERNILRAAGYNVTVAINGLDALTKMMAEKFDLVVSDIEMPEINGFELTERLRKDDKFKDIPIILVTSLASEADRKKGLGLGANAYITKGGFDQEELLFAIRKLLN